MKLIKIPVNYLEEMKTKGFSELDPYTHKNPIVKEIFWKRLKTMLNLAPPAQRVLDFGAGSGVLMPSLSKQFKEVHCFDINTDSLEYVKNRFNLQNVTIKKGIEGRLPYKDDYFDIIFAADVLEHVKDQVQVQKELQRILKKGGHLIVSGPTENLIYKVSRRVIYWFWEKKEDHFSNIYKIMKESSRLFTIKDIKTLPSPLIPGFKVFKAKNGK